MPLRAGEIEVAKPVLTPADDNSHVLVCACVVV